MSYYFCPMDIFKQDYKKGTLQRFYFVQSQARCLLNNIL